jgi:carbonic anhydrase/acetyltransferase-like protein (isoleucine patch superfamily)
VALLRRVLRQVSFWWNQDRPASGLRKFLLGLRYDSYVSRQAQLYYPGRIRLAKDVSILEGAMLNYRSGRGKDINLSIGAGTKIMPGARLIPQQGFIQIGSNCTIQYGCVLYGVGGLQIGNDTRIAAHTVITPMNHVHSEPDTPIWQQGETALGIRIGNDVWIGNGVRILDGVEIGDGCVIGAGSVVTRSLPPYSVAIGSPARVLRSRGAARSSHAVPAR